MYFFIVLSPFPLCRVSRTDPANHCNSGSFRLWISDQAPVACKFVGGKLSVVMLNSRLAWPKTARSLYSSTLLGHSCSTYVDQAPWVPFDPPSQTSASKLLAAPCRHVDTHWSMQHNQLHQADMLTHSGQCNTINCPANMLTHTCWPSVPTSQWTESAAAHQKGMRTLLTAIKSFHVELCRASSGDKLPQLSHMNTMLHTICITCIWVYHSNSWRTMPYRLCIVHMQAVYPNPNSICAGGGHL